MRSARQTARPGACDQVSGTVSSVSPLLSLDTYLDRIGLAPTQGSARRPGLAEIHRAHATSVPFENFDPYSGSPVSLDLGHLESKIVGRRRGGYCFEHNLLLGAALESIGATVEPMLARVRLAPEGEGGRPLDHLTLRVTDEAGVWLADVGFGGGGLLDPVPFELGTETDQSGWRYRLMEDGREWVLQVFQDGDWTEMFSFVPEPVPRVDIEVSNWYTATHPTSSFVNGIMAGLRSVGCCLTFMMFDVTEPLLIERPVGGASSITPVALDEVPSLLAERFALAGVIRSADGRFVLRESAPGAQT
jgi:N-hydroxyarylamine O-acetyltransferase